MSEQRRSAVEGSDQAAFEFRELVESALARPTDHLIPN